MPGCASTFTQHHHLADVRPGSQVRTRSLRWIASVLRDPNTRSVPSQSSNDDSALLGTREALQEPYEVEYSLKAELKRFCETRPRKRRGMFPCERCHVNRSTGALSLPLRRSAPLRRRPRRIDPLPDGSF